MVHGLLFEREVKTRCGLTVRIPTVGEVCRSKGAYDMLVNTLTATPYLVRVQLDNAGEDFTKFDDYKVFLFFSQTLRAADVSLVFGEKDALAGFKLAANPETGEAALVNPKTGVVIDKAAHEEIAETLRTINGINRVDKHPGNEIARKYMIKRGRLEQERAYERMKNKPPRIEAETAALVNSPEFPYDYDGAMGITIYQFRVSLAQVIRRVGYDKLMIGYYNGTIDRKKIPDEQMTWLPS